MLRDDPGLWLEAKRTDPVPRSGSLNGGSKLYFSGCEEFTGGELGRTEPEIHVSG